MPTLKLRRIAIDTYRENVAYLHRDCALYRSEGFQALNKIEVHREDNGQEIIAVLNVVSIRKRRREQKRRIIPAPSNRPVTPVSLPQVYHSAPEEVLPYLSETRELVSRRSRT